MYPNNIINNIILIILIYLLYVHLELWKIHLYLKWIYNKN